MLLSAGDKLGPYEILALACTDGMGEVCRARDPLVKRDVAIKVSAGQFSERLEREARAVAALNHPTFAPVMTWAQLPRHGIHPGNTPLDEALKHKTRKV